MKDLGHALETLSRAGLRRTPQRLAVIEALIGDTTHPTVDALWSRVRVHMPSISLSTVYTTLRELESLGLVQYVADDPLRVDPDVATHTHLTCRVCGQVVDIPDAGAADAAEAAAARLGHSVTHVSVSADGMCAACRRRQPRTGHA